MMPWYGLGWVSASANGAATPANTPPSTYNMLFLNRFMAINIPDLSACTIPISRFFSLYVRSKHRPLASGCGKIAQIGLIGRLHAFNGPLLHPGHQGAQPLAHLFDGMLLALLEQGAVMLVAALIFFNPAFGEFAALHVLQGRLHPLFHAGINNLGANGDIAPFGGFRDGKAHAADAGFVHQINDEFQFMEAFKIDHLRLVTGFHERFESRLDQRAHPAAKPGPFAE